MVTKMTYVMSDIHNRKDRYDYLRKQITEDNHLYILGDVIDRSEDGSGIDILLEIMEDPLTTVLLGNHERMMLVAFSKDGTIIRDERAFMNWLWNGGNHTYKRLQQIGVTERKRLFEFLHSCSEESHIRLENGGEFYLCHAWPTDDPRSKLQGRTPQGIHSVWGGSHERLVFGHTVTVRLFNNQQAYIDSLTGDHLRIVHEKNWSCIDCGSGHDYLHCSALAMLRLDDGKEFYAI